MSEEGSGKRRIALFGGSFDPVHNGHLMIARYALKQVGLERVIFVPTARSPLKQHGTFASDDARVEMLEMATQGESRFKVDTFELEQGGMSYTVDTVAHFDQQFEDAELFFILGADQFFQLERWHKIEELAAMVTFLSFGRSGVLDHSLDGMGLRHLEMDAPLMDVSSSEIRAMVKSGGKINEFVEASVAAFICQEGLYAHRLD